MAAAKCNISFDVHFTSSKPIQKAIASYRNKNSSSAVPYTDSAVTLPAVPYYGNSLSVILPDIQNQGEYDLIIALTDSDGFVAKQSSSFKIGNCKGNTPPKVNIKWQDNSGTEARICNTSPCTDYIISVESSDSDNDIVRKEVFISQDNGNTWTSIISDLSASTTFDTGVLSSAGTRLFKVVVTDSVGNATHSNILSYTKEEKVNNIYRLAVPAKYSESGWENGHTGGTASYDGYLEFKFSSILNVTGGFVRLKVNGDNNEFGLQRTDNSSIIINKNMSVTELFRENLYASCTAVYQCTPTVNTAGYTFEFSNDGVNNWQQFTLYFFM